MMHDVGCFDHAIKLSPSEWKNNSVKGLCPWLSKFDIKVMIIKIFNIVLAEKLNWKNQHSWKIMLYTNHMLSYILK